MNQLGFYLGHDVVVAIPVEWDDHGSVRVMVPLISFRNSHVVVSHKDGVMGTIS